jgi:RNA polymerase sigma-70 factor (ECF subfamily)
MPAQTSGVWFEAIFREHYSRVVALLARLTGDRSQAEEIAADVFCKVSQRGPLGIGGDDPAPWIYRVATNYCLNQLRAMRLRGDELDVEELDDGELLDEDEAPADFEGDEGDEEEQATGEEGPEEAAEEQAEEEEEEQRPPQRRRSGRR